MKTPIDSLADFAALDPFFRIIERGLAGLAGPGHFFDLLAEDITVDYVITVPATRGMSKAAPPSRSCTARTAPRSSSTAALTCPCTTTRPGGR